MKWLRNIPLLSDKNCLNSRENQPRHMKHFPGIDFDSVMCFKVSLVKRRFMFDLQGFPKWLSCRFESQFTLVPVRSYVNIVGFMSKGLQKVCSKVSLVHDATDEDQKAFARSHSSCLYLFCRNLVNAFHSSFRGFHIGFYVLHVCYFTFFFYFFF